MDSEIDLRGIIGLLHRNTVLILTVFSLVVAIAALVAFTTTPIYTATALVMVDPSDRNLLDPQAQFGTSGPSDARIEGEVLLARADNVLLSVIDRENLADDPEFQPRLGFLARILSTLRLAEPTLPTPHDALRQSLDRLAAMLSVQRNGKTFLISIDVRSTDPDRAARLANAVARAYIDTQLLAKVQGTIDARNVLEGQIASARQAVVQSEGSFDRFIHANLPRIVAETGNTALAPLRSQIADLSALRQATAAQLAELQTGLANRDFAALADRLADQALATLERERQDILGQLGVDADSALAIDLRGQLAAIEDRLTAAASAGISSLEDQIQAAQSEENAARQTLRSAILSSGLSPDALTEIYDLQQTAGRARQQYDQLVARAQDLQAQASLQMADSRIVSPALRPGEPSSPNIRLILLLAIVGGLALGISLAFLYEHFIGGITTDEQLARLAKTRMALAVPRVKLQGRQHSASELLISAPLSAFSESVRRIRSSIDHTLRRGARPPKGSVVVVTSTAPGEGKTTLALSIARSYALAGRSTILIDCDMRHPSVHRYTGQEPSEGLLEALSSDNIAEKLRETISQDDATSLLTLLGSHRSDLPTDQLVTSRQFDRLIDAATHVFEVVILDTPPIAPVVDGLYIAQKADILVYLVQWATTGQSDLRKALISLESALPTGTAIIPVLNQQDQSAISYYRRYARYYSDATA